MMAQKQQLHLLVKVFCLLWPCSALIQSAPIQQQSPSSLEILLKNLLSADSRGCMKRTVCNAGANISNYEAFGERLSRLLEDGNEELEDRGQRYRLPFNMSDAKPTPDGFFVLASGPGLVRFQSNGNMHDFQFPKNGSLVAQNIREPRILMDKPEMVNFTKSGVGNKTVSSRWRGFFGLFSRSGRSAEVFPSKDFNNLDSLEGRASPGEGDPEIVFVNDGHVMSQEPGFKIKFSVTGVTSSPVIIRGSPPKPTDHPRSAMNIIREIFLQGWRGGYGICTTRYPDCRESIRDLIDFFIGLFPLA